MWEDDANTAEAVWDLIRGCEEHDLPLGAVMLDSPWSTAYNNFVFDEKRYPKPRELIEAWHKKGIRTVLWMTCLVNTLKDKADAPGSEEDLYAIGKACGYFCNAGEATKWWKGRGAFIDYTNPEAVAWWHRLMDRALDLGIDGWKVDGAAELILMTRRESSRGVVGWQEYVDLYYRDCLTYLRARRPDGVTMVRSVDVGEIGYRGRHAPFDAAPLTWVGDQRHTWDDLGLQEALAGVFRAMELGYPVASSDTGGYQTDPAQKGVMPRLLFLRWAQWNALTPFFLVGGHNEHRPWKFDAEFFWTFRRYWWLHHELVPFFYSQAVQAHLREGNLMHAGTSTFEYQLGDALLVGVMTDERPEREVKLPAGKWLDYWDNHIQHEGGQTVRVKVPEERSPVFVRLGAILSLNVENDVVGHGSKASKGWRTLDIYPHAGPQAVSRAVVWDTASFPPQGERDRSIVNCQVNGKAITINLAGGPARNTILRIWSPQLIKGVTRDTKELTKASDRNAWERGGDGWWSDPEDQRLWVRLSEARNFSVKVELR